MSKSRKEEIHKEIGELLNQGYIIPSTSPSKVQVPSGSNKKYGTELMFIYSRALNKVRVKNMYPITRIYDLLDELGVYNYLQKFMLEVAITKSISHLGKSIRQPLEQIRVFINLV